MWVSKFLSNNWYYVAFIPVDQESPLEIAISLGVLCCILSVLFIKILISVYLASSDLLLYSLFVLHFILFFSASWQHILCASRTNFRFYFECRGVSITCCICWTNICIEHVHLRNMSPVAFFYNWFTCICILIIIITYNVNYDFL